MPVTTEYIKILFNTTPMSVYVVLICSAILCTIFTVSVKGLKEGVKTSSVILLIIYAAIVVCTTVMFRPDGSERGIKFTPFWSYFAISDGHPRLLEEDIMNVVAFVPIGLLLAIGAKRLKWWQAAIVGCSFSGIIEFMQFYFDRGQCEIDDVIHNTLGCIIGFQIIKFVLCGYYKLYSQGRAGNDGTNGLSIFEIQQSKQAREFVLKNGSLGGQRNTNLMWVGRELLRIKESDSSKERVRPGSGTRNKYK